MSRKHDWDGRTENLYDVYTILQKEMMESYPAASLGAVYKPHSSFGRFVGYIDGFFEQLDLVNEWKRLSSQAFSNEDIILLSDISSKFYVRTGKNVTTKYMTDDPAFLIRTLLNVFHMFARHGFNSADLVEINRKLGNCMKSIWNEDFHIENFLKREIKDLIDRKGPSNFKHLNSTDVFYWKAKMKLSLMRFIERWERIIDEMESIAEICEKESREKGSTYFVNANDYREMLRRCNPEYIFIKITLSNKRLYLETLSQQSEGTDPDTLENIAQQKAEVENEIKELEGILEEIEAKFPERIPVEIPDVGNDAPVVLAKAKRSSDLFDEAWRTLFPE